MIKYDKYGRRLIAGYLAAAVVLALWPVFTVASAGAVTGSEGIAGVISATDTGDITTATSVSFSDFFDTSGSPAGISTGDFLLDVPLGTLTGGSAGLILPGGLGYSIGNPLWGNFTGNLFKDLILPGARTDYFSGVFTPGLLFGTETASPAELIIAFTQAGDGHNAISASLSLSMVQVPEPDSITIVGTMALISMALVIGFRRRCVQRIAYV
jgi:hypothetical protein